MCEFLCILGRRLRMSRCKTLRGPMAETLEMIAEMLGIVTAETIAAAETLVFLVETLGAVIVETLAEWMTLALTLIWMVASLRMPWQMRLLMQLKRRLSRMRQKT